MEMAPSPLSPCGAFWGVFTAICGHGFSLTMCVCACMFSRCDQHLCMLCILGHRGFPIDLCDLIQLNLRSFWNFFFRDFLKISFSSPSILNPEVKEFLFAHFCSYGKTCYSSQQTNEKKWKEWPEVEKGLRRWEGRKSDTPTTPSRKMRKRKRRERR